MKSQIQPPHLKYLRSLGKKFKELTTEEVKEYSRYYREPRRELIRAKGLKYRADNKKRIADQARQYRIDNKESASAYNKQYRIDNKESIKQYQIDNKEHLTAYMKQYNKTSQAHKLRCWLLNQLKRKGESKTTWIEHIGCTRDEFKAHIESQFVEGMCWDNWTINGWHMDHIHPLSKGGSNHYTNIQPLWWYDNLSKSNKIVPISRNRLSYLDTK